MAGPSLTGTSLSAEEAFSQIVKVGVSPKEAQTFVAGWILQNVFATAPVFDYKTPFAASDPSCTSLFRRTFEHEDWVDGEDVVQAEETTNEQGFNVRFHRIEDDLDALGRDVAKAFLCLGELRSSLRALLDEIRSELNALSSAVADLQRDGGGGAFIKPIVPGKYLGATKFFGQNVHAFETDQGIITLPSVSGAQIDAFTNPRILRAQALGSYLAGEEVKTFFDQAGGPVTKKAFLEKFGDETLPSGETVRDALSIVPDRARFAGPQAVMDSVAESEGRAIRTSVLDDESVVATLGLESGAAVAEVPVDRLAIVPSDARAALVRAGLGTVGDFAGKDASEVAETLRTGGVEVSAGDVAGWIGAARTLMNVR